MEGYPVTQVDNFKDARLTLDQTKFGLVICENTINEVADGALFLKEIAGSAQTLLLHDTVSDPNQKSKFNIEMTWWSNIPVSVCAIAEVLTQN